MMKRRQALQSLISLPAITALPAVAQQAPAEIKPAAVEEFPKLPVTRPDAVCEATSHFLSAAEMKTLEHLSAALLPPANGKPGALEAGAPAFLGFLLSESPAANQGLYRRGLARLDSESHTRFHAPFHQLDPSQTGALLAPLETPWTFQEPPDELARFLRTAKDDVLRATFNSREWAAANTQRRAAGMGTYWFPAE